ETPRFVVANSVEEFDVLVTECPWMKNRRLVIKAHEVIGGRGLRGLVKMCKDLDCAREAVEEILAYNEDGIRINQVIVQENVKHNKRIEYYTSILSRRDGIELLLSPVGGVHVESRWDLVQRLTIHTGTTPDPEILKWFVFSAGFLPEHLDPVADFLMHVLEMFDNEDVNFLEINPFTVTKKGQVVVALDAVVELDDTAKFRHPDWTFEFSTGLGRSMSHAERRIQEIDEQVKGSVKFIELGGDTALLPAGGGASVFLADAVVRAGGTLANYAEYSGDPPDWAVEALTEKVCSLKGIKRIIIGGAIANFTDVKKTFTGIILGLRKAREEGKLCEDVSIWVRRGGPNEEEALREISKIADEGFKIRVFDRKTPLTDIVDMAFAEDAA
ncbi:MAG: ATP citrate lyase citrate-binding domain-containing protein, partial [Pseudomonadota bacterium]